MVAATWISRSDLPGLACPYCGRQVDPRTEWTVAAQQAWGRVGVAVSEGHTTLGLLLLAPIETERAAMVMTLWVAPEHVRQGHGRRLVQATASGMLARDVHSVLARGSRTKQSCTVPPGDFLKAVGFTRGLDEQSVNSLRSSPASGLDGLAHGDPARLRRLYRLDLDQTVTERPGLFEVLGRWVGSIRPVRPQPAGRVTRQG